MESILAQKLARHAICADLCHLRLVWLAMRALSLSI
jgi:hypothetical protein